MNNGALVPGDLPLPLPVHEATGHADVAPLPPFTGPLATTEETLFPQQLGTAGARKILWHMHATIEIPLHLKCVSSKCSQV